MNVGSPEKQEPFCTEDVQSLADREFVADLIANKPRAWERFIDFSAKIIAYHKKHLNDFGFSIYDLTNTVYIYLTKNNHEHFRNFLNNDWSLFAFTCNAFRASMSNLLYPFKRDRKIEVSDSDPSIPLIVYEDNCGHYQSSLQDYREVLKMAFFVLCKRNSQRANIYYLRRKLEMPSKEVAELLDMTITNVDVVLKRAESDLKNILEEMGMRNDILHD
jgi:hypothetical protein